MAQFPGLQYCKTDLMADKGIVFCKFCRASQALAALETIGALGTVRRVRLGLAWCQGC